MSGKHLKAVVKLVSPEDAPHYKVRKKSDTITGGKVYLHDDGGHTTKLNVLGDNIYYVRSSAMNPTLLAI